MKAVWGQLARALTLVPLSALALQVYFLVRVMLMTVVDPQSTTFQRSEAWRLLTEKHQILWSQQWVGETRISVNLKRAVIASEDAGFAEHSGVEWDALEKAWERNQKAEARVEKINEQLDRRLHKAVTSAQPAAAKPPDIVSASVPETLTTLRVNSDTAITRSARSAASRAWAVKRWRNSGVEYSPVITKRSWKVTTERRSGIRGRR